MVSNRMIDGVGKKIVDALKQQTDSSFIPHEVQEQTETYSEPIIINETPEPVEYITEENHIEEEIVTSNVFENVVPEPVKPAFSLNNMSFNTPEPPVRANNENFINEFEDFELPTNVEVLKQLIAKLPANVSKQTGAQIIKQTMEALGISMKGVLQEAQTVQENLNASARECQNNIAECKRQISLYENQTQKLHRQYSTLNDIISLFLQTGN